MTIHCSFTIEFKRQKWGFHIAFFDWKGVNQKTSVRWNSSDRTFVFDIGIGQLRQWVIHFCICFFFAAVNFRIQTRWIVRFHHLIGFSHNEYLSFDCLLSQNECFCMLFRRRKIRTDVATARLDILKTN